MDQTLFSNLFIFYIFITNAISAEEQREPVNEKNWREFHFFRWRVGAAGRKNCDEPKPIIMNTTFHDVVYAFYAHPQSLLNSFWTN